MTYFIWLVVCGLLFVVTDSVGAVGADGIRPQKMKADGICPERNEERALKFKVNG
jgi:hypothetical protein